MSQYYNKDMYFTGSKDQIIHQLTNEIKTTQQKIGNYDILRKNMVNLELQYRDLLMTKAKQEQKYRGQIGQTNTQNSDMKVKIENMKEQIHLLSLKNNQLTSEVKRQKTVNQARQDELRKLDEECRKKDMESIEMKHQLELVVHQTRENRQQRDQQMMDNQTLDFQNNKQEENIARTREQIQQLQMELNGIREQHRIKDMQLKQKQTDIQRRQDAILSTNTEIKRIEAELNGHQTEQKNLDRQKRDIIEQNRHVEKNFYAEQKRQEDLERQLNDLKKEVDQLEARKSDLVRNTDKLSGVLKDTIERTNYLKDEVSALDNMVKQYEIANQRILDEMQEQSRVNEDIVTRLSRSNKVSELQKKMQSDISQSEARFPNKSETVAESNKENGESRQPEIVVKDELEMSQ